MSFEHAPITKGAHRNSLRAVVLLNSPTAMMLGSALSSFLVGLFDVKYYFHVQVGLYIFEAWMNSHPDSWYPTFLDTTK
jgi:hypothetical protein